MKAKVGLYKYNGRTLKIFKSELGPYMWCDWNVDSNCPNSASQMLTLSRYQDIRKEDYLYTMGRG